MLYLEKVGLDVTTSWRQKGQHVEIIHILLDYCHILFTFESKSASLIVNICMAVSPFCIIAVYMQGSCDWCIIIVHVLASDH